MNNEEFPSHFPDLPTRHTATVSMRRPNLTSHSPKRLRCANAFRKFAPLSAPFQYLLPKRAHRRLLCWLNWKSLADFPRLALRTVAKAVPDSRSDLAFANADNDRQTAFQRGRRLGFHQCIAFPVIRPSLRVPHDDIVTTYIRQHPNRYIARMGSDAAI